MTFALGTTAPVASVTVPAIVPWRQRMMVAHGIFVEKKKFCARLRNHLRSPDEQHVFCQQPLSANPITESVTSWTPHSCHGRSGDFDHLLHRSVTPIRYADLLLRSGRRLGTGTSPPESVPSRDKAGPGPVQAQGRCQESPRTRQMGPSGSWRGATRRGGPSVIRRS